MYTRGSLTLWFFTLCVGEGPFENLMKASAFYSEKCSIYVQLKSLFFNPYLINPWVRKIPRRRAWQTTPGFLPKESHGQRSLVGYGPWDHKESDTTE